MHPPELQGSIEDGAGEKTFRCPKLKEKTRIVFLHRKSKSADGIGNCSSILQEFVQHCASYVTRFRNQRQCYGALREKRSAQLEAYFVPHFQMSEEV